MRTTVSLPDSLVEDARRLAARRGVTFSALVGDALRLLLANAPTPFRMHTVRGTLGDCNLNLNRTSALMVQEDEVSFRR
jgi:metal-responsive CopG/Arc/MetJ family transcriptional regulator